ncbi:MAG: PAS domain S-box protein [Acidobacteriia bacterium]|nr:PAS domain S-box protein [Terriglobia bacterium]
MNLRVLICGEESDAQSWLRELRSSGADVAFRVASLQAVFDEALAESWDVVLSDYRMRDFGALDALDKLRRRAPATPLVVVAGAIGEQAAAECMRAGAAAFVGRDDGCRLMPAIEQAIREAREREARARAERELFSEMESNRAIVQRSLAGFYRTTVSGKMLDCNDAFARIFGYESAAEIKAMPPVKLYRTPADREAFLEKIRAQRQISNLVTSMPHRDGSTIWLLENTSLIEPEDGSEARIEGTIIDITSRVQAEEEQARLRAQLVKIACEWIGTFDAVIQPLVVIDRNFNIARLNLAFKKAAGLATFQECIGKPLSVVSTDEPWRSATSFAQAVVAGNAGTRRVQGADGKFWEIDGAIFPGSAENDPRTILTFRDVTSLETLQRNLRLSEQHFRTLIENATDLVVVIDDGGVIRYASPAGKRLLGYPREQVLGRSITELIHPEDLQPAQSVIANLGDVPMHARYRLRHLNGTWRNFEFVGVRVRNEAIQGIVINARDITDRVRAEEELALLNATLEGKVRERTRELAQANAELSLRNRQVERSSRMKSVFLANMSHELRTPLNAIIGFTELLREEFAGPLNDKQKDYLGHVFKASKHLLGLINDVLDLAKIEAGQISLNPEPIDLPAFLADVSNFIAPMAAEKGLTCEAECEPGLMLYTDAARLRQILLNLLGNAVKFTPEHGSMKIRARRDGGYITISVIDSGVGIPVEEQEAVFEEFFRASLGAGVSSEGSGLGLPMVKRLVERMGGSVKISSAPHQGSEFSFTIPMRADGIGAIH